MTSRFLLNREVLFVDSVYLIALFSPRDNWRANPSYTVVPHDVALMEAALDLYTTEFANSTFSLQDCVAIVITREYNITSILTADQEFARASFTSPRRYLG